MTLQGERLNFSAKTRKECQEWLKKTIGQIDDGMMYDATCITFETYLEDWLTSIMMALKSRKWKQYHQVCTDYTVPRLGRIKLKDLRPEQIFRGYAHHLLLIGTVPVVRMVTACRVCPQDLVNYIFQNIGAQAGSSYSTWRLTFPSPK